ncbi:alpha-mannosidase [Arthrobacter castelli]|uniref:alpha-mannosidase n=1 Tax=Arthrobacter castelli TaxID=271431 RepID=UPI00040254CD|nr:glycoside hydrolase family 38 C-terminal domain-containing protein [Arthrobacter castelli]
MHDNRNLVEARIDRFMAERLAPNIWRDPQPLTLAAWDCPGEPVPFAEASGQDFRPFKTGEPWGAPWGTVWFRITGTVPQWNDAGGGSRPEVVLDPGFTAGTPGFQAEGMVYRSDGTVLKALEPRNQWIPLDAGPGEPFELFLEAASNPDVIKDFSFAPTPLGDKATAGNDPLYTFRSADIALLDVPVWDLVQDFRTLNGLMHELPVELPRRHEILRALERAVNAVDPDDVSGTAAAGRDCLSGVLASPAYTSGHRMHAVGHAHIDSAWLWPVRETVRKVARTFSNVVDLMDSDPDFVFAASSAQQYAWLKECYPDIFARVAEKVRTGQFVPAGGMWVESDTNLPGGEALARQFVHGKRFFLENFGVEPLDVWLPDSFGYSAALPQIVAAAGSRWFLTQKISWNETNVMPHHTFRWEGIDGTRVFTHFPPVDTYNAQLSGAELALAQRQYREKGFANTSLVPFGWGDGGGGPTREMLAAAARTRSLEGSPAVELSSPQRFFSTAEAEYPQAPVWSGELYLEFHRGTYTSQARTKRGNRRSEHLLREAELWATTAAVRCGAEYPYAELERTWQTVLLQQFHDILPGTSIAWVHQEAERNYADVAARLETIIERSVRAVLGSGTGAAMLNAGPYMLDGVPAMGAGHPDFANNTLARTDDGWQLSSAKLSLTINDAGQFTSLIDRVTGRETIPAGQPGNLFQLFRDTPNQWDAWDIDAHYKFNVRDLSGQCSVVQEGQRLRIERSFGSSSFTEWIGLSPDGSAVDLSVDVDWHERQKMLKLAFPLDVHADRATSEIQFGHIHRPTHANTSWDEARFETVAHRWVHVTEPGFGVAVANDSTYGYDISRDAHDGGTCTTVRLSLLRAPLFPDPGSDQGLHHFRFSVRPAAGIADAISDGYRLNLPLRQISNVGAPELDPPGLEPLIHVDNLAVVVEAVKLAEDRSGDVVVRLYEAHGGRAEAMVSPNFDYGSVSATDLLERTIDADWLEAETLTLRLRPFQLVTLRFHHAGPRP